MRVVLVNAHGADPSVRGAEHFVGELASGLQDRGHDVAVVSAFPQRVDPGVETHVLHTSDWRDDQLRRVRNHVGDTVSVPWPGARRLLARLRPDVVATSHLSGIGTGIWRSAHGLGAPVVHYLHDFHLLCPRTSLLRRDGTPCHPSPLLCGARTRALGRWTPCVSRVLGGSQHLLDAHAEVFGQVPRQVIRLPVAPLGRALSPPTGLRAVGYLGALTEPKGVGLLLEAAPGLAALGVAIRVAGEGPLAEAAASTPNVTSAGRVSGAGKLDFLEDCDAGVVPSLWREPSGPPYVVCEWLAARRPVVVTPSGGLAETVSLPGVRSMRPTADGLVAAVAELAAPGSLQAAVAPLGPVDEADRTRWLDEHEAALTAAA